MEDTEGSHNEWKVEGRPTRSRSSEGVTKAKGKGVKTSFDGYQPHCASLEDNPWTRELLEPELRSDGHCTALNLGTESWWLELIDLRLSQEPERKGVNSQVKGVWRLKWARIIHSFWRLRSSGRYSWNPHAPARLTTEKVKVKDVRSVTVSERLEPS